MHTLETHLNIETAPPAWRDHILSGGKRHCAMKPLDYTFIPSGSGVYHILIAKFNIVFVQTTGLSNSCINTIVA